MIRPFTLTLLLVVAALMATVECHAQDAAQASFHDARAREHYRAERYEAAVREFFLVQRVAPNPRNVFNIALCFVRLDRPAFAVYYFSAYLQDADDAPERQQAAMKALMRLRPTVAGIRLSTTPSGAEVFVDQIEHGSYGRTPVTIPVEPGTHHLWIRREGHRELEMNVVATRGAVVTASIALERIEGRLVAVVEPPGQIVVRDSADRTVHRGTTPLEVGLAPGVYVVEAAPPSHRAAQTLVTVAASATVAVRLTPEALPPPTGRLIVTANLPGALVELDGTPIGFTPAVLPDVPIGSHRVRLSAPRVQAWQVDVDVPPDGRGFLTATLEAPPANLPPAMSWIAGGVGVAALTAGAIVQVIAARHHDDFAARISSTPPEDLVGLRATGQQLNATGDGLVIGGAVALAVGAVIFLLDEPEGGSTADVSWVAP